MIILTVSAEQSVLRAGAPQEIRSARKSEFMELHLRPARQQDGST